MSKKQKNAFTEEIEDIKRANYKKKKDNNGDWNGLCPVTRVEEDKRRKRRENLRKDKRFFEDEYDD